MSDSENIEDRKKYIVNRAGSFLYYVPNYYPTHEGAYDILLEEVPWNKYPGDSYRFTCFMGQANKIYPYTSNKKTSDWHWIVEDMKSKLEKDTGYELDSCLLNYYPDGTSTIGPHGDRECKGKDNATVVISLGETRDLVLKQSCIKKEDIIIVYDGDIKYEKNIRGNIYRAVYPVKAGDLYVMGGYFHSAWTHSIPKRMKVTKGRISLTFRKLY